MFRSKFRWRTSILCLVMGLSSAATWGACLGDRNAKRILTLAVVPQLPRTAIYTKWAPLLEQVGQRMGQCFDLIIPDSTPAFEKLLFNGDPDLAFANPYHMVIAKKRQRYAPLLIDGSVKLTGILVIKADSPIQNIHDLQDKKVAFPSQNAFAASLLIRAELAKEGIRIQPRYANTHASAYRAAAMGEMAAAGGVNNTWVREDPVLRASLRILYETPGYAPHPLLAHPRVSSGIRKGIIDAFMSLNANEAGQKLLEGVQMSMPLQANYQRDFAPLERLGLEKFAALDEN